MPIVDSFKGLGSTLTEGEGTRDMMFAGASFLGSHLKTNDPGAVARSIHRSLRAKGFSASKADDCIGTLLDRPARLWKI